MAIYGSSSSPIYAPARKTGPLGPQPIRILIADDIAILRGNLRRICEAEKDFQIVAEASDSLQTVQLAEELKPDIILLDIAMPDLDSTTTIGRIRAAHLDAGVIILTNDRPGEEVIHALQAGARAHFPKSVDAATLVTAIRAVHEGQAQIDSQVTLRVLEALRNEGAGGGSASVRRFLPYE
jgi:DNA-binding NarL/FixJ family response regulator